MPRWLISITDMPLPCQSSISSAAWRRTGFGQGGGAGAEVEDAGHGSVWEAGARVGLPAYKKPGTGSCAGLSHDLRRSWKRCREAPTIAAWTSPCHARPGRLPRPRRSATTCAHWRQRRRLSQLDLASEAEISTRHLSFVETGRSAPSREMVLRLAERLDVPLRERNALLVGGRLRADVPRAPAGRPGAAAARAARCELSCVAHEPYPALAVDRHWNLVAHNAALPAAARRRGAGRC